jgi:predicted amidohydrolase YtcJ
MAAETTLHADLVLTNGKIVTVDGRFSIGSAIAVRKGEILAVGDGSLAALAAGRGKVVDLAGACVVPGLVDCYSHVMTAGLDIIPDFGRVDIARMLSVAEILEAVAAKAARTPPGEWIGTSCMYRGGLKEGRWPDRWDLDRAAPDHPVYIMQGGRPIIANSRALALAGFDDAVADPVDPPGRFVRDEAGRLTGQLVAGAADLARRRWSAQKGMPPSEWDFLDADEETLIRALEAEQAVMHACGFTATRDYATMIREVGAYATARRQKRLKLRTQLMINLPGRFMRSEAEFAEVFASYFQPWTVGDDLLNLCGVCVTYSLDGWQLIDREGCERLIRESNRRGWTVGLHPGEDEQEVAEVLDMLDRADRDRPLKGRRFPVMHPMGFRRPEHIRRAVELGLVFNPNPLLNYHAAERSLRMFEAVAKSGLQKSHAKDGFSLAAHMWGLSTRDWIDAGLLVTAGSNIPAAIYDTEAPLLGAYCLLTGDTRAGVLAPGQGITRREMIEVFTINGARSLDIDDRIGSLEPGKRADMAVLDRDILDCPDREIAEAKVLATYFDGELVHER